MRKIISLGLVFAMCLGLTGCGNGSKYNLKDAKTCTIEGISFQYPKEWEASDVTKTQSSEIVSFFGYNGDGNGNCDFDVHVYHNDTKDKSLEYFKKQDAAQILDNITVAGQDCCHVKFGTVEFYFFDSPKGMVSFSTSDEDVLKILPEMLKTITIDQKYNLKDAETFNIEGISFQYPKAWGTTGGEKTTSGTGKTVNFYDTKKSMMDTIDVRIWYNETKDSILENFKNKKFYKNVEVLDNITVAGQDCYHIKLTDNYDDITEEYIFDSSKGVVVFCNSFVENNIYNETLEDFEDISKVLPDILKTVTIEE